MVLNISFLFFEALISSFMALKLSHTNKMTIEVFSYIIKGSIYIFSYEAVKVLLRHNR